MRARQIHNLFVQVGDVRRHPPEGTRHPNEIRGYDKSHFVNADSLMSLRLVSQGQRVGDVIPGQRLLLPPLRAIAKTGHALIVSPDKKPSVQMLFTADINSSECPNQDNDHQQYRADNNSIGRVGIFKQVSWDRRTGWRGSNGFSRCRTWGNQRTCRRMRLRGRNYRKIPRRGWQRFAHGTCYQENNQHQQKPYPYVPAGRIGGLDRVAAPAVDAHQGLPNLSAAVAAA